ncbi:hypothetical protein OROMI_014944 [Orobanche minor]
MKRKASEIDKSKIEKGRGNKGGFMSMGSGRMDTGFGSDNSMSGVVVLEVVLVSD